MILTYWMWIGIATWLTIFFVITGGVLFLLTAIIAWLLTARCHVAYKDGRHGH